MPSERCWPLLVRNRPKSTWCFKSTRRNWACRLFPRVPGCAAHIPSHGRTTDGVHRQNPQVGPIKFIAPSLPFQGDQAVDAHAARAPAPPTQGGGPQQVPLRDGAVHNQLHQRGRTIQTFVIGCHGLHGLDYANQLQIKLTKIQTILSCEHLASKPVLSHPNQFT